MPLLLVAALFLLAYQATLVTLVDYWTRNDVYSYAFLVPPIAAIFVWLKRDELRRIPPRPALLPGAALTLIGLLLLLAGRRASVNLVEELSLVVTISGLVLLLRGGRAFRVLAFPIGYLLAAVPIWDLLTSRLHPYFQSYSAAVGVGLLRLVGVPVHKDGVVIQLPHVTLEVTEACSGINYLIAILCIGIPLTQLFVVGWPRQLFIVLAAVVVAVLSNGLRVAMVSLFAYYDIRAADGDIHGPYAFARSLMISGVGYVVLCALIFRFAEARPRPGSVRTIDERAEPARRPAHLARTIAVGLAVLLLAAYVTFERLPRASAVEITRGVSLPDRIGRWEVRSVGTFSSDLQSLEFDDTLSKNYAAADGTELNLFIGYFRAQVQGRELAGHGLRTTLSPPNTSPGPVFREDGERPIDFMKPAGQSTYYVTHWYVINGTVVSDDYRLKLQTAANAILRGRTNGAVVAVKARASDGDSLDVTRTRVADFVESALAISKWAVR
ncbi:MAG TPA: EpsI family protein [Vicinamibacterales bacterium]|nr:EpsI family protein [Vicinamibacterales bacterium]